MEKSKFDYIKSFEGLKGIAILMILLYHIFPQKMPGGFLGILIFFTITGFLMMRKFVEEDSVSVVQILKKRINKIYPQMLWMIFIICVLTILFFKAAYNDVKPFAITSLLSINNYYQIIASLKSPNITEMFMPFRHMWAVSLWLQSVLLFSVIMKALRKNVKEDKLSYILFLGIVLSVVLMGVIYVLMGSNTYVFYAIETQFFSFLLGAYVSYKMRANYRKPWKNYLKNIFTNYYVLIILVSLFIVKKSQGFQYVLGFFLFSLFTAGFLERIYYPDTFVAKVLTKKPLVMLGKNAFAIYLWQYPILVLTNRLFANRKIPYGVVVILHLFFLIAIVVGSKRLLQKSRILSLTKGLKRIGQAFVIVLLCITLPTFTKADTTVIEKEGTTYHFNAAKNVTSELNAQIDDLSQQYQKIALDKDRYLKIRNKKILCVGDTVILNAKDEVMNYFPRMVIDAKETRQFVTASYIIEQFMKNNDCDIILIELGTNGVFSKDDFDRVIKSANGKPIYFINTVMRDYWEEPVNNNLKAWTQSEKNARLIDWFDIAKGQKELLEKEDRKHTTSLGSKVYAQLIAKVISEQES